MAVSSVSGSNSLIFGGLATGLDTDSIIKQLMQVEKVPLTRLTQKKTALEWKKDAYREVTNLLRTFKDEYFDVLKPATNMTSLSAYKRFSTTSSSTGVVSAVAGTTAAAGTHSITITQLAEAGNTASTTAVSKELTGTAAAGLNYTATDNQLNINLNGVTKTLTLRAGTYATTAELITNGSNDGMQNLVDAAFGSGKIVVSDAGAGTLKFEAANSKLTISSATANDALANLKITSGSSNRINTSSALQDLSLQTPFAFDGSSNVTFTINDVDFSFASTTTLSQVINTVNSSAAGVELRYSELDDKFSLTAKTKGAGSSIVIENTGGNFFDPVAANSAIKIASGTISNGKDVVFDLDGVNGITRNDNTFVIDGVSYTANSLGAATVTVAQDVDQVYDNIKAFVDKYNEIIGKINTKLSEKTYRDFTPLTDEQKSGMKEEDITLWEQKAKSGLLRSDSIVSNTVTNMRKAIYESISGVTGSLSEIGITTGSYEDKGKLIIDETKLKAAIQTNPDKVQDLFAKSSSIAYSATLTPAQRTQRYSEEGIANRLFDIIQDNIRTLRDSNGKKGLLVEKAGITGDISEFLNLIDSEITRQNTAIYNLQDKISRKETAYYKKFAALEKAVSQMNSQGSWLSQQFSGS